ncbi:DUF6968 family protein [Microvirga antarctica]|uniref:DUF6968 family protein n=1 Tax=Microvirga antarctica TaxID=2819233 RepID=UPI001B3179E5|nr:hypothetical protein [Microvirga antarctica]
MLIATRELEFVTDTGAVVAVPVCVFAPVKTDQDWGCRYTIGWPNGIDARTIYGIDSAQALVLATQGIGSSLYASDYHKTGRLRWVDPHQGYGFPVTKIIRDMLIGYDKESDG